MSRVFTPGKDYSKEVSKLLKIKSNATIPFDAGSLSKDQESLLVEGKETVRTFILTHRSVCTYLESFSAYSTSLNSLSKLATLTHDSDLAKFFVTSHLSIGSSFQESITQILTKNVLEPISDFLIGYYQVLDRIRHSQELKAAVVRAEKKYISQQTKVEAAQQKVRLSSLPNSGSSSFGSASGTPIIDSTKPVDSTSASLLGFDSSFSSGPSSDSASLLGFDSSFTSGPSNSGKSSISTKDNRTALKLSEMQAKLRQFETQYQNALSENLEYETILFNDLKDMIAYSTWLRGNILKHIFICQQTFHSNLFTQLGQEFPPWIEYLAGEGKHFEEEDEKKILDKLENILSDPIAIQAFQEFLNEEHSAENLNFWRAVESYKRTCKTPNQRATRAQQLFLEFVQQGAPQEVNIEGPVRTDIIANLKNPSKRVFENAQKAIFELMRSDSLNRFLNSKHGSRVKSRFHRRRYIFKHNFRFHDQDQSSSLSQSQSPSNDKKSVSKPNKSIGGLKMLVKKKQIVEDDSGSAPSSESSSTGSNNGSNNSSVSAMMKGLASAASARASSKKPKSPSTSVPSADPNKPFDLQNDLIPHRLVYEPKTGDEVVYVFFTASTLKSDQSFYDNPIPVEKLIPARPPSRKPVVRFLDSKNDSKNNSTSLKRTSSSGAYGTRSKQSLGGVSTSPKRKGSVPTRTSKGLPRNSSPKNSSPIAKKSPRPVKRHTQEKSSKPSIKSPTSSKTVKTVKVKRAVRGVRGVRKRGTPSRSPK